MLKRSWCSQFCWFWRSCRFCRWDRSNRNTPLVFLALPNKNKPVTQHCWVTGLKLESVILNTIDEDQTDEVVSQPIKSGRERRLHVCVCVS